MPAQYDNCCCCCCRLFLVAHLQLQVPLLQPFLLLLLPLNASLFVASLFVSSNAGRINYECYASPLPPSGSLNVSFLALSARVATPTR